MLDTHRSALASAALLLAFGPLTGCRRAAPDGVALVGATLFDGSGGPVLANSAVVVRRGRIESVGTRAGFELPARTREVDVSGRWIIPGLIDVHAHVEPWALPRYLAWGVTTVRDLHGGLDSALRLRSRVNLGSVSGPRIYSAGAMIDGLPTTYPDAIGASSPRDARKAVDRLVNSGADLIKVYTRLDPSLLRAVVDEAHTFNLRVAAHLGMTDAVTAAREGVTSIEHLSGVPEAALPDASSLYAAHYRGFFVGWTAFERSWAGLDSAALARVAKDLSERDVTLVPTLVLHETFSQLDDPAVLGDSMIAAAVPQLQQARWNVPDMIRRAGWTDDDYPAFRAARPQQDRFLRMFFAAGGRIATGTDASNQLLIPGYSEHRELQLLVGAGFSPRDALLAATRNGALTLGVDSLGLIAPGKVADLLVLTRDPLSDIRHTLAIDRVMTRGSLLSADSIRKAW
ncbi:MAG TPA: amidohydrolase family protein [Gemmatimonadales bacterium]|nr:amidohydrolase family protein [Gemmatimonadales bacterium]